MPDFYNNEIDGFDFYRDDTDISFVCNDVTGVTFSSTLANFDIPIYTDKLVIPIYGSLSLSASTNDFDLTAYTSVNLTSTADVEITGINSLSENGKILILGNYGSYKITLKHQSSSSASLNRFFFGGDGGSDYILLPGDVVVLQWRMGVENARWGLVSRVRSIKGFPATTPAQITSNQNNYSTLSFDTLRLATDASREITGFANGIIGKTLYIMNIGSFNIVLKHQSASSTSSNRMILGNAATDVTILPGDVRMLRYDEVSERWRLVQ
jgi:hypothetical protein